MPCRHDCLRFSLIRKKENKLESRTLLPWSVSKVSFNVTVLLSSRILKGLGARLVPDLNIRRSQGAAPRTYRVERSPPSSPLESVPASLPNTGPQRSHQTDRNPGGCLRPWRTITPTFAAAHPDRPPPRSKRGRSEHHGMPLTSA